MLAQQVGKLYYRSIYFNRTVTISNSEITAIDSRGRVVGQKSMLLPVDTKTLEHIIILNILSPAQKHYRKIF